MKLKCETLFTKIDNSHPLINKGFIAPYKTEFLSLLKPDFLSAENQSIPLRLKSDDFLNLSDR